MAIAKYFYFQITQRKYFGQIKKQGFMFFIKNLYLKEKEALIIQNTDILADDFDGKFSAASGSKINCLYEKLQTKKKGLISKDYFSEIVLFGDEYDIDAIESCIRNKFDFTILDSYIVNKARCTFNAEKSFLTREEDYEFLDCAIKSVLNHIIQKQLPAIKINIVENTEKRHYDETYYGEGFIYKDFFYDCQAEGPLDDILQFKSIIIKHKISSLIITKKKILWQKGEPDIQLEFFG